MISTSHIQIEFAGEDVWLLADRALYWPKQKTLILADLHLGKAPYFRQAGLPVPVGTTEVIFSRLDKLITQYSTEKIYFLGDLFHNVNCLSEKVLNLFKQWRKRTQHIECFVIPGNHDKTICRGMMSSELTILAQSHYVHPFTLLHDGEQKHAAHAIAGHVHPVYWLKRGFREKLKFPCFVTQSERLILPAFGEFVGGYAISLRAFQAIYLCCEQNIASVDNADDKSRDKLAVPN